MKRFILASWFVVLSGSAAFAEVRPIGTSTDPTYPSPCPPCPEPFNIAATHCPIDLF